MSIALLLPMAACSVALAAWWWVEHLYRRPLKRLINHLDAVEPPAIGEALPSGPAPQGTLIDQLNQRIIRLNDMNHRLQEQAIKDPLTGLGNRRLLEQRLDIALPLSRRWMHTISALVIDVDHFKEYNDLYGHQAGDECLVEIANVLRDTFRRETDIVVRLGGEEFLVVLLDADEDEAVGLAEAMRGMLQAVGIEHEASSVADVVTVSIGVAVTQTGEPLSLDAMIATADTALYACKAAGRNRVISRPVSPSDDTAIPSIA
ncbi:GGDEF domain-containing protein [Halomonas sp. YLGW01]|uniref:GGDEF domain-containing protein n=1 Tax=Halomonas sp. YLGW01 TaxID=2773308 RepID=UPI00177D348F|nr:GGDEF domain-containing protein [Halomonas sp. YLGW01]